MATHTPFHGETAESANAAGDAIDAYLAEHTAPPAALTALLEDDDAYSSLRGILAAAITNHATTTAGYTRLGKNVAVSLGSEREWGDPSGFLQDFAEVAGGAGLPHPGSDDNLAHYRALADAMGLDYERDDDEEEDDEDDEDTCDAEGCDESLSDGEGYDGYCGTHADERENDGVYDGDGVPA